MGVCVDECGVCANSVRPQTPGGPTQLRLAPVDSISARDPLPQVDYRSKKVESFWAFPSETRWSWNRGRVPGPATRLLALIRRLDRVCAFVCLLGSQ